MLTVDTHHIDGYLSSDCNKKFRDQYSSVIYCSDNLLGDFIDWIQDQDFYDNTSVVIVGDHLSMDPNFFREITHDRQLINVFINSAVKTINLDRNATVFDIFPTTLASLGVEIESNRLGLGTNLFSTTRTLTENYSIDYVNSELSKISDFYSKRFTYGSVLD